MKVRLQFPPTIEAVLDVVAADQRVPLRLSVDCLDGSAHRLTFRWAGIEDGAPVAMLESIEEVGSARRFGLSDVTPGRKLLEG
jgi:hypothetical protein